MDYKVDHREKWPIPKTGRLWADFNGEKGISRVRGVGGISDPITSQVPIIDYGSWTFRPGLRPGLILSRRSPAQR